MQIGSCGLFRRILYELGTTAYKAENISVLAHGAINGQHPGFTTHAPSNSVGIESGSSLLARTHVTDAAVEQQSGAISGGSAVLRWPTQCFRGSDAVRAVMLPSFGRSAMPIRPANQIAGTFQCGCTAAGCDTCCGSFRTPNVGKLSAVRRLPLSSKCEAGQRVLERL